MYCTYALFQLPLTQDTKQARNYPVPDNNYLEHGKYILTNMQYSAQHIALYIIYKWNYANHYCKKASWMTSRNLDDKLEGRGNFQ